MIIFNTTFHTELRTKEEFVTFLKEYYIPKALESGLLSQAQLAKVISDEEQGVSLALQFKVDSEDALNEWHRQIGVDLNNVLTAKFQQKVVGFSTLLEHLF